MDSIFTINKENADQVYLANYGIDQVIEDLDEFRKWGMRFNKFDAFTKDFIKEIIIDLKHTQECLLWVINEYEDELDKFEKNK